MLLIISNYKCSVCHNSTIKLYRYGGEFLREKRIYCKAHFPAKDLILRVPLVEDALGNVMGITSITSEQQAKWDALPDE